MFDKVEHKTILIKILKEIYSDPNLRTVLGFKGGTATYLFYDLPRLSVDLDFDLLKDAQKELVRTKMVRILSQFGRVTDAFEKRNTLFFLLNYKHEVRNIKVEISKRKTGSTYEVKNYLGISMLVMEKEDLAANKLAAFLTRTRFAARDLFDLWFFLTNDWRIGEKVTQERIGLSVKQAVEKAIQKVEVVKTSSLLHGLGELVEEKQKNWIRNNLKKELVFLLKLYLKAR